MQARTHTKCFQATISYMHSSHHERHFSVRVSISSEDDLDVYTASRFPVLAATPAAATSSCSLSTSPSSKSPRLTCPSCAGSSIRLFTRKISVIAILHSAEMPSAAAPPANLYIVVPTNAPPNRAHIDNNRRVRAGFLNWKRAGSIKKSMYLQSVSYIFKNHKAGKHTRR